jgi:hypothetical protein
MTAAGLDWMTTVLRSGDAEVPGWQLLAGWTDDGHLLNTLQFAGEQPHLAGGFGGPPVWDGQVLNYWYGTGPDGSGLYAMVRTLPRITNAWVSLDQTTTPMPLSEPYPDFGVRFGACRLPTGGRPPRDLRPAFNAA